MEESKPQAPSTLARNAVGLTLLQFFTKALSALWTFYLARRLGVELYGLWANILALISIFGVLHGLGTLGIIIKEVIQKREKAREYLGASFLVYGVTSISAFLLIILACKLLGYSSEKMALAVVAGASFIAFAPGLACQSVIYGFERFILYTVVYSIGTIAYMLMGVVAIETGRGVMGIFAALSLGYVFTSFLLYYQALKICGIPVFKGSFPLATYLAKLGFPLVLSSVLSELMLRADRILIDRYIGLSAVGYYHSAFNIVYMPREIFFIPLATAFYTRLCFTYVQDRAVFEKLFEKLNVALILLALVVSGFCMVVPNQLIAVFYGKGYESASGILSVLSWMLLPFFILVVWQNVFILQNRTKTIFQVNLFGTILSLLFNYIFLRRWGVIASAYAAIITQLSMLAVTFWILRKERLFGFIKRMPRLLLSFAFATFLLHLLKPAGSASHIKVAILLMAGTVIYIFSFFLFRVITKEEIEWIKKQASAFGMPINNVIDLFQWNERIFKRPE